MGLRVIWRFFWECEGLLEVFLSFFVLGICFFVDGFLCFVDVIRELVIEEKRDGIEGDGK